MVDKSQIEETNKGYEIASVEKGKTKPDSWIIHNLGQGHEVRNTIRPTLWNCPQVEANRTIGPSPKPRGYRDKDSRERASEVRVGGER